MKHQPDPPYSTGRVDVQLIELPRYEGTAALYSPAAAEPGATSIEDWRCGHQHLNWDAAEDCARRGAAAEVRRRNKAAVPGLAATPCDYRLTSKYDMGWLRYCAGHHTTAGTIYPDQAVAEATPWTCPWDGTR